MHFESLARLPIYLICQADELLDTLKLIPVSWSLRVDSGLPNNCLPLGCAVSLGQHIS